MHVICPKCQAGYRLNEQDEGTILVCHRCGHEFPMPAESAPEPVAAPMKEPAAGIDTFQEAPAPAREEHASAETSIEPGPGIVPEQVAAGIEAHAMAEPPARKGPSLWPWLLIILLAAATAGFWINRDAWLSDPWLRSVLINMDVPLEARATDWRVIPESVQTQWLRRDDGKQVLVIEGRVKNLLQSELPPPNLELRLFAAADTGRVISERILPITQPPLLGAIRHAPYSTPPKDTVPVSALGSRGFILVLEDAPESLGNFILQPAARR